MTTYRITRDLIADGPDSMPRQFRGGETIGHDDMLAGCLQACLTVGYIVVEPSAPEAQPEAVAEQPEHPERPEQPEPQPEPVPEPPRRRGR